jgi:putative DNA primase/helicase
MADDIEDGDETPDAKLMRLSTLKGTARDAIAGMYKVAARMSKRDKPGFTRLMTNLSGWSALPDFRKDIAAFLKEGSANAKARAAEEQLQAKLDEAAEEGKPVLDGANPIQNAILFCTAVRPHMLYRDKQWLEWHVNAYREVEPDVIRRDVQAWAGNAIEASTGEAFALTKRGLDELMDFIRGHCTKAANETEPPAWLNYDPDFDPDPRMQMAALNGLYDLRTDRMQPNTPGFFTRNGLDYAYNPDAPPPVEWLKFLDSIWPGQQDNHDTLQEIMGHLLTGETKYQKIFLFVGAPRAGKGIIIRIITKMVGEANVVGQSVTKLGKDFGLKALLGKSVLVVPDMRLGKEANTGGITETLLNISGEDAVSVSRKYQDDKQASKLNARIVLVSNMGLFLPDQSGALLSRFVPLVFHRSFTENPDTGLEARLLAELPSILKWSVEGLRRLESKRDDNGRLLGFTQTREGSKLLRDIGRNASQVQTFIKECCVLDPGAWTLQKQIYAAFEGWCKESDITQMHVGDKFLREIKTASGYNVDTGREMVKGKRRPVYTGIRLREELAGYKWQTDFDDDED